MANGQNRGGSSSAVAMRSNYRVTSVERTDAPTGAAGRDWYQYVLRDGESIISGQRQGTRDQVTQHAQEFADELNARSQRGYRSTWSPRRKRTES